MNTKKLLLVIVVLIVAYYLFRNKLTPLVTSALGPSRQYYPPGQAPLNLLGGANSIQNPGLTTRVSPSVTPQTSNIFSAISSIFSSLAKALTPSKPVSQQAPTNFLGGGSPSILNVQPDNPAAAANTSGVDLSALSQTLSDGPAPPPSDANLIPSDPLATPDILSIDASGSDPSIIDTGVDPNSYVDTSLFDTGSVDISAPIDANA